jgi:hydrogenase maturation protease
MGATHKVPVLLCGEPLRGDDGVALEAAHRLDPLAAMLSDPWPIGQLDPAVLVEAAAERPCVVVDALVGVAPGVIVDRPLHDLAAQGAPSSTHLLPPRQVVALAEALGADLAGSRLVGVGGADFTLGAALSPAVRDALPSLTHALGQAILELAARPGGR